MKEMKDLRIGIMMEPSLCEQIDTYRFQQRINTRAETIRRLIKEALATKTKTATE